MIDEAYDVVVAGGGPAGLSAAQVLAAQGLRVLIVEKHAEIGSPTRTSGGSFIADMVRLGIPPHLYHPVQQCRFLSPAREATFSYRTPVACVVNVRALYQYLAERAIDAGAALRPRTQAIDIVQHGGAVRGLKLRDHRGQVRVVSCALVVDATGFPSTLAVKAGIHAAYRRVGVGAEYDLFAPSYPQESAVLAVGSRLAPAGYAYAFPYGHHRVRAGVGVIRPDVACDPADFLDDFIRHYEPLRAAFAGASPIEFHTGVIPVEGLNDRLVADGLLTAGDSAGQSSALVGEGIRFSIYAGRLAGRVGAAAVRRGDVSAAALAPYEREWRRRFGRNLRVALAINRRMAGYSDAEWDERIDLLGQLSPAQYARLIATDLSPGLGLSIVARRPLLLRRVARTVARSVAGRNRGVAQHS